MKNTQLDAGDKAVQLRIWPGVIAVTLLWAARFGLRLVMPGFEGFSRGMIGGLIGSLAIVLWWAFFSRAPRAERWGIVGLMVVGLFVTTLLGHESMGPLWLVGYAIPLLCTALVVGVVATRRLDSGARRLGIVATVLVATLGWTVVRTIGIDGHHVADFEWRWSATSDEKLAAQAAGRSPAAAPYSGIDFGDEWPGFRGSDRDGTVRGSRIETDWVKSPPVELWRRQVGPAWSSVAIQNGLLYTQEQRGEEEAVVCYDAATGEPVWVHTDAARFFESNAGAGPRSTPTLHEGRVFTLGATGILNALEASNGALVWSRNISEDTGEGVPDWGFSSSPLVLDGAVIVAASGRLAAYDASSGALQWQGESRGGSYSSPHRVTVAGVEQIVLMSGAGAVAVSPLNGDSLWEHDWRGFPMVQPAVAPNGDLLIAAGEGSGVRRLAIRESGGDWKVEERWTSSGLKPYFNGFVVHDGYVFGFDGRILSAIALEDGRRMWKGGRYGSGQMVLLADQDLLLVLSEKGELALVAAKPDAFQELARIPAIEGKSWNHPVVVGDLVVIRNGDEMAAFRLPVAGG